MNVVPLLRSLQKKETALTLPVPAESVPVEIIPAEAEVTAASPLAQPIRGRVREWIRALQRNPSEEEIANTERRRRLLEELSQAVAEAPDDIPIRDLIGRINHHNDD